MDQLPRNAAEPIFNLVNSLVNADVKEHQATTKKRRDNLYKECVNFHFPITGNAATATKATQDGSGNVITSTYLPISGGTLTGDLLFADSGTDTKGIHGTIGSTDAWRLVGGASATNAGWLELATADDGAEPIYVRQYSYTGGTGTEPYNHFGTIIRSATLLDASGNTSFPGTVTASGDIYYKKYVS